MDPTQLLLMLLGGGLGAGQAAAGQLPRRNVLFGTGSTFDPVAEGRKTSQGLSGAAGGPGGLIQLMLLKRMLEKTTNPQQTPGPSQAQQPFGLQQLLQMLFSQEQGIPSFTSADPGTVLPGVVP